MESINFSGVHAREKERRTRCIAAVVSRAGSATAPILVPARNCGTRKFLKKKNCGTRTWEDALV
jgi:hypothetical protein